ncbi:peptide deformylase [Corynebacterium caspium]|uniref:peptide deformylase n=1 Tax=Corynebacterium caspium TaxID=234828 RepID=UPI00037A936B|nr:peptide deformylase [Corynebacterium caspium]WKD59223.1 Peptide deformylase [Corynebacterium caspium DSM 44850]
MASLRIRLYGDPVLNTPAAPVSTFDASLRKLVSDMTETMFASKGAGLAANQVGILERVFVFDCRRSQPGALGHIINPVWEPLSKELQIGMEGCLSIPGISLEIPRYKLVRAWGRDIENRPISIVASGLLARCIQHEVDHLDGKLFFSHATGAARKEAFANIAAATWYTGTQPENQRGADF